MAQLAWGVDGADKGHNGDGHVWLRKREGTSEPMVQRWKQKPLSQYREPVTDTLEALDSWTGVCCN